MFDEVSYEYGGSNLGSILGIVGVVILVVVAFICLALLCGVSATDAPGATRVLQESGYTHVHITGYRWFTCGSESDHYQTGFEAIAPNGAIVTGTVCKGLWFKSSVIHLD